MTQEQTTIDNDEAGVQVEAKQEPLDIGGAKPEDETQIDPNDPRAAIYARHAELRRQEIDGSAHADEEEVKPPEEERPQDEEITVKVNGKERRVPRAKVEAAGGVDAYQKNAAASELLNQASAKMRQANELEAQINARAQQLHQQEEEIQRQRAQQRPAASPPEDAGAMKDLARRYHEALADGDMDAADDLLVKMQAARNSSATPDADEIASKAAEKARQEIERNEHQKRFQVFERERLEKRDSFASDYPDIAEDPELLVMTDRKTKEVQREHPDWSPAKIIDEAATRVRNWIGGRTAAPTSSTTEKLDAKRSQTTIRGGSARAANRPAPPPQSRSQYVSDLRKQRGLE
jgi:hypothetical protein